MTKPIFVLGALAALVGIAWIAGGRPIRVRVHMPIAAPPEKVFEYLVTPELMAKWMGLVETVPLTSGGLRVGARSRDVIRRGDRQTAVETEILVLEPGRRLDVSLRVPGTMRGRGSYVLHETSGGTELRHELELRFHGLSRLLAPAAGPAVTHEVQGDLRRLAEVAG